MSFNHKQKNRDFYKERPYSSYGHHNSHHNQHHSYGPKRYGGGAGAGGGGGNGGGPGMGMGGANNNSNHHYQGSFYRPHGHPHGGYQESRSHYPHHHHHSQHPPHHGPSHHQGLQQGRTTSPQQRAQTPNMNAQNLQPRQQSPSQSQMNTSTSSEASSDARALWNAANMEQVASYLEGLYLEANELFDAQRRSGRCSGSPSGEVANERTASLGGRRARPNSLVMDHSNSSGAGITSPKHGGYRGSGEPYSYSGAPFGGGGSGQSAHPINGGGGGSRGGSSSSSHEQGASSSDDQQYTTPDPPASPTSVEVLGQKPGVQ